MTLAPQVVALSRRRMWPVAAGLLAVVLLAGWIMLPRTVANPPPLAGRPLTVLTVNTCEGNADVAAVADLIHSRRPDLVSLVEAGAS